MAETQDTEITLGTGRLLGMFFGLVIVCALFFGLGFSLGRSSTKSSNITMEEAPAASAPGQSGGKTMAGTREKPALTSTDASPTSDVSNQTPPLVVASPASASANSSAPELAKAPLSGSGAYTVQVAAVSKEEDAEALVDALKKKAYPVFLASAQTDKLFHVQVGPFSDIKDAEAMKAKLTGDGYNPIVKR